MATDFVFLIAVQYLAGVTTVLATYAASPYLQYQAYPSPAYTSYPAHSYSKNPAPVYTPIAQPAANYQPSYVPAQSNALITPSPSYFQTNYPTSYTNTAARKVVSASQPTAYQTTYQQPSPVPAPKPPVIPKIAHNPASYMPKEVPSVSPKTKPNPLSKSKQLESIPPFDSNVLNNLAIALQLLIVSNLIHNPPSESRSITDIVDEDIIPSIASLPIPLIPPSDSNPSYSQPYYESNDYPQNSHYSIPNANFLGSSSYGDIGIPKAMMSAYGSPTPAKPRSLKSPYDAIASNSPFVESSPSGAEPSSPYNLNADYNKLFSLSELFKV